MSLFSTFSTVLYEKKNETLVPMLVHKVKQRQEIGVMGKFYVISVLTVHGTDVQKILNVALNLPKL